MFLFPAVSERRVTEFDWLSTLSQRPLPTIISQTKQYKSVPNLTKFSGFIAQHKFKRLSSSYIVISISMTFFQFPKTSADKTVRLCWPFVWLCLWDLAKEVAWVAPDHLKPLHIQNIRFYNMLSLTYSCDCEMLQPRRAASSYPSVTFNRCARWLGTPGSNGGSLSQGAREVHCGTPWFIIPGMKNALEFIIPVGRST